MLVIGVEYEPSSELTIEQSSVEGPSQIMTSIEEEEKRNVPKVFNEVKSPQKMIEMEDNKKGIEENTPAVIQGGDRTKHKLDAIGDGRLNNTMRGGLQATTKEIQGIQKEEKENDVGRLRDRGEKERRNAKLKVKKLEKKRNRINCGHYSRVRERRRDKDEDDEDWRRWHGWPETMKKPQGQAELRTTNQRRRRGWFRSPTDIQGKYKSEEDVGRRQRRRGRWSTVSATRRLMAKEAMLMERREPLHDRWGPPTCHSLVKRGRRNVQRRIGEGNEKSNPTTIHVSTMGFWVLTARDGRGMDDRRNRWEDKRWSKERTLPSTWSENRGGGWKKLWQRIDKEVMTGGRGSIEGKKTS
ncbi:unnamed protein product [Citrullus colocynthis]|uniref:Uncharacterized protein n=1 Tax=Citrullus colocynthis TaxID=252529 RepID=A0ABP0Z4Y9_9ROSI